MSIQFNADSASKICVVRFSRKLAAEDYGCLMPLFKRLVRESGKLRLLFDMTDFHGWEAAAAWADLKLGLEHFADIERIAISRDDKWQHGMAIFCQPLTKTAVRYFDRSAAPAAYK